MADDPGDTIVAPATAPGEAAVALIRVSGPAALGLAARHFRGSRSPEESPSHHILFGQFVDGRGDPVDTVLVSIFRAPRSYTGEDVVEISSHGGAVVPAAILDTLIRSGARPARPGEFTERAFRNGKLDLAQAEAVAALVRSRSDSAARAAGATLGGALSRRVDRLDAALVALLAEVEARIDFPADAGEPLDAVALARRCGALASEIEEWVQGLPGARRRESGLSVVLAGPPNVGKSSLLNALVGYDRAIVSEIPGTTRDTVESSIWIEGIELRLTDTAGLRESHDPVERLGIERTASALERTDLAVVVLDRSDPEASVTALGSSGSPSRPVVVAWNKADLARGRAAMGGRWAGTPLEGRTVLAEVETVAIAPAGAAPLRNALRDSLPSILGGAAGDEVPATSARQEALLADALAALRRAEAGLAADESYDLIAVDLTEARRSLGEMVGRGVDQGVIAAVFARFCIGK
ncbi:MAG TPA: tRNA uridine-5-carboxymethylaminomethyl(34) synthesis GTPase MnmE [Candidatus Eisenbacteria bacterium]|nr:tRNA uridine-5-carboxymethylaminomethyl(34) synthesis GTPase MnmE [Candidatus Eisenbacteria bacterium]